MANNSLTVALGLCLCLSVGCLGGKHGAAGSQGGDTSAGDVAPSAPIDVATSTGWGDSTKPMCRESYYTGPVDLWADDRGVVALLPLETTLGGFMSELPPALVAFNDGSGWRDLAQLGIPSWTPPRRAVGFPGGPLLVYSEESELFWVDLEQGTATSEDVQLRHVFVVGSELAYGLATGDPQLVFYDGDSWGPFPGEPLPYQLDHVWADESAVFCAGDNGLILSHGEVGWTVHDTGTLEAITALWGFAGDDVWAGTSGGDLLHWDGDQWSQVPWPGPGDESDMCQSNNRPIDGMWGTDGRLFFHNDVALMRHDADGFRVLAHWPGELVEKAPGWSDCVGDVHIRELWGTSPSDVFLLVEEGDEVEDRCAEYLLWWDGVGFRWI